MNQEPNHLPSSSETTRTDCQGCAETPPVNCMDRRRFLKLLLGVCALSWGAMATFPIFQYLFPVKTEDSDTNVTSVSLGKADALSKGSGRNFKFGHRPALIVRDENGDFHAFSAICSHLGCTVQFSDEKKSIYCACHGGQYDAKTGKNIAGPPPKPLQPLNVEVQKGEVIVSLPAAKSAATQES